MSLLQASNFRVTIRPERPTVSVLYKPTGRRYTYTAVADRVERSRRGSLAPGFCVDRDGVQIGRYDDGNSEAGPQARPSDRRESVPRELGNAGPFRALP
jgi:hypothetical protein